MYWVTPILKILSIDCQANCADKPYMMEEVQK